jgi:CRISPR-associated endonuclease/helicase Cas3
MKEYYAHSKENCPTSEWQRLEDHSYNVAVIAQESAKKFQSADWAWNTGWLHDLGKVADAFQTYLLRENGLDDSDYDGTGSGKGNHSSAGGVYAQDIFGTQLGLIYAYVASGHHAGLPDYYSADTGRAALTCRLEEGKTNLGPIRSVVDGFAKNIRQGINLPSFVKKEQFHLWVRMLFSCLVDADFLDTENFMTPDNSKIRSGYPGLILPQKSGIRVKPLFYSSTIPAHIESEICIHW